MRRLTRTQTIRRLRALDVDHGPLTFDWLDKHHPNIIVGAFRHFDGLPAARQAAGVRHPQPSRKWSIERIVNELRAEYRAGVRVTIRALIAAGREDLVSAISLHLGGIERARRIARIPTPPRLVVDAEPHGSWDELRVVLEIIDRRVDGLPLNVTAVPTKLLSAGVRLFGSWAEAIGAAGLDYDEIRLQRAPYTKSAICEALRKLARTRPGISRGELYEQPFANALATLFGSLDAALSAANIADWPRWRRRWWTRQQVLDALRARAKSKTGDIGSGLDELARHYFGGVPAARKAAGLPLLRRPWTKRVVLAELRTLARRGKYRPDRNLRAACDRYFGGVVAARRAAKIELPPALWSRDKIIALLREHARKGAAVISAELAAACCRHFGSVTLARQAANLERDVARWTERDVSRALRANLRDPYLVRAVIRRQAFFLGIRPHDLLDEAEVAAMMGVARTTLSSRRGRALPMPASLKLGRYVRYRRTDVESFIAATASRGRGPASRRNLAATGPARKRRV